MLTELEKIYADFESAIDRVTIFINTYAEIKALDIQNLRRSKYYKTAEIKINKLKTQIIETQSVKYNAIIVSLYGRYELAIKQLTKEVIRYMVKNNVGEADKLKNENLSSVLKTIERKPIEEKKGLIEGLYLLFNQDDISGYNFDLSLNNYQNLKTSVVYDIAKIIGITNLEQHLKLHPFVVNFIKNEQDLPNTETALRYINSRVAIFSEIDDLVDSRNKIAHEGFEPHMIADSIILNNLIPKLKLFVKTYLRFLQLLILEFYETTRADYFIDLSLVRSVINKNVICFNTGTNHIKRNDIILITTDTDKFFAKIVSIQINGTNVDTAPQNVNVGCQLDINVKDSYQFRLFLGERSSDCR